MRIIKLVGSNDIPIEVGSGEKDELYGQQKFSIISYKNQGMLEECRKSTLAPIYEN